MIDELYIDGSRVDMADDSGVSLEFKSNLFADMSKIAGSFSHTIKLPLTANNMRIIDGAIYPSSGSRFPYKRHAGTILRDGIEIISNADVYILSVGDDIQVALAWNIFTNMSNLFSGNVKLKDLLWVTSEGDEKAYKPCSSNSGTKDNPSISWGVPIRFPLFYRPVVSVSEIFWQIKNQYGIDIISDIDFDQYIIPLTANNVAPENQFDFFSTKINDQTTRPSMYYRFLLFDGEDKNNAFEVRTESIPEYPQLSNSVVYNHTESSLEVTFSNFIVNVFVSDEGDTIDDYSFDIQAEGEDIKSDTLSPTIVRYNNKRATLYYNGTISVTGERFRIALPYDYNVSYVYVTSDDGIIDERGDVTIVRNILLPSDNYYLYANMPDVSVADVIKTICALECMYVSSEGDKIIFSMYSDFYSKIKDAYNWSDYLVVIPGTNDTSEFHLDNFGQKNWFKWKDDTTTEEDYNGTIIIDDEYYGSEQDIFTSAFSASDTVNGIALIPIYTQDENSIKYKDVKPRMLVRKKTAGQYYGKFGDNLSFKSIIDKNYSGYKKFLTDAKQITVSVKLSPIELKSIDLTNPVYIGQYGCFFAILEIKTKKNNICEVKLLKM